MFWFIVAGLFLLIASKNSIKQSTIIFTPNKSTLQNIALLYGNDITSALNAWDIPDVDPYIIVGQIYVESNGNPQANGDSGNSYGLMQIQKNAIIDAITYGTDNDTGQPLDSLDNVLANVYDKTVNIHYGVGYLAYLMNTYSLNIDDALKKYNTGSNYFTDVLVCQKVLKEN